MPGRDQHEGRVGQAGDVHLGLTDPDRLDQHHVAARALEHPDGLRRRRRRGRRDGPRLDIERM